MSGILDSKSRVMDVIVTLEGRRQAASADLRVQYVSFTDNATYYRADIASGSADATNRIYLEACNLPQDSVTFEANDSGRLGAFKSTEGITVNDGQILGYSFDPVVSASYSGSNASMMVLTGDEFASTADRLLLSAVDNFKNLQLIATKDNIFEDDGFGVGNTNVTFAVTDTVPFEGFSTNVPSINDLEGLFQDPRLSNLVNFKFLPPLNKVDDDIDKSNIAATSQHRLGGYVQWGRTSGLSPQVLEAELLALEKVGCSKLLTFEPTSLANRILCQTFEVSHDSMRKLDVIDYGSYVWKGEGHHAYFVGRVLTDDRNVHTFVHLFTLVFG